MQVRKIAFSLPFMLFTELTAAHAGHSGHESSPDLLVISAVIAGSVISSILLYFSIRKYADLEQDPS
jgi:hypothetical protein